MNVRIAALAAVLALSSAATAAQSPGLGIAIVRPDGILVPLGVFDGAKWVEAWPEPTDDRRLDRMVSWFASYWDGRAPVPQLWHAAARPSAKPQPLKVLTTVVFDEHCGTQIGLLTDMPRTGADAPGKRLALSLPSNIEWPIDVLAAGTDRAQWQPLIDRARTELAKGDPKTLTAVHGFADGDIRIIVYEASRNVRRPETVNTSGGFIVAARGVMHAMDAGNRSYTLLGIIRPAGTPLWVVTEHGYESEALSLLRIDDSGVQRVFSKFIGGC